MTSLEPQYLFKDSMRKHNRTVRRNDEVLGLGLQLVKFMIFFQPITSVSDYFKINNFLGNGLNPLVYMKDRRTCVRKN